MLEPMKRETANTGTPARSAKVAYVWRRSYRPRTGAMPAATWAGLQWRRPKTRKSIRPLPQARDYFADAAPRRAWASTRSKTADKTSRMTYAWAWIGCLASEIHHPDV